MNITLIFLVCSFLLLNCSSDDGSANPDPEQTRSFLMGFTAFPYDADILAVEETVQNVVTDGDTFFESFRFWRALG